MGKQRKDDYLLLALAGASAALMLFGYIVSWIGGTRFSNVMTGLASVAVPVLIIVFHIISAKQKKLLLTLAFALKAAVVILGAISTVKEAIEYKAFGIFPAALIVFALAWVVSAVISLNGFSAKKFPTLMLILWIAGMAADLYIAYDQISFAMGMKEIFGSRYVANVTLLSASDILLGGAVVLLGLKKK